MTVYTLPAELTVYTVNDTYQHLVDTLTTASGIVIIEAHAVEEIDGCGIQLLTYFASQCQEKNTYFQCDNPSESLKEAAKLLNVSTILFPLDEGIEA